MAREVVRKICGHAEAVYAVGSPGRIARKIERSSENLCRICRDRLPQIVEVVDSDRPDDLPKSKGVQEILKSKREGEGS